MKLAKATSGDILQIVEFLRMIDEVLTSGIYTHHSNGYEEQVNNERFKELISEFFEGNCFDSKPSLASAINRVIFGYETLVETCCDPDLDYLEWRADVKQFLEEQAKIYNNTVNEQDIQP